MKFAFLFLLLLVRTSHSSLTGLTVVKQPVYMHGSDADGEIKIVDVVIASILSVPESYFSGIVTPYKPPAIGLTNPPANINLPSLYGISISSKEPKSQVLEVTVDASKAVVPEGYPFTIQQVIDATCTCVKLMNPAKPESEQTFTLHVIQPKGK